MRNAFFLILFWILGPQAWAQALPSCWPAQIRGTGGDAEIRETETAIGAAWRCGSAPPYRYVRVCRLKNVTLPGFSAADLTGIGAARAAWTANVRAHCREPQFMELDDLLLEAVR